MKELFFTVTLLLVSTLPFSRAQTAKVKCHVCFDNGITKDGGQCFKPNAQTKSEDGCDFCYSFLSTDKMNIFAERGCAKPNDRDSKPYNGGKCVDGKGNKMCHCNTENCNEKPPVDLLTTCYNCKDDGGDNNEGGPCLKVDDAKTRKEEDCFFCYTMTSKGMTREYVERGCSENGKDPNGHPYNGGTECLDDTRGRLMCHCLGNKCNTKEITRAPPTTVTNTTETNISDTNKSANQPETSPLVMLISGLTASFFGINKTW